VHHIKFGWGVFLIGNHFYRRVALHYVLFWKLGNKYYWKNTMFKNEHVDHSHYLLLREKKLEEPKCRSLGKRLWLT